MRSVKGCINKKCVANQKKIVYKTTDDYCSKCGNKLYVVCRKCYMQLPNSSEKYCVRCLAKKQDHKDQNLKKAGGAAALGVAAAVGVGKKVAGSIVKWM